MSSNLPGSAERSNKNGKSKAPATSFTEPKECCIVNEKIHLLKDLITCSICLQILKYPKMLPCQHTFCKSCLKKLHKNSNLCPKCRRTFQIPCNGVAGFPESIFAQSLLEIFEKDSFEIVDINFKPVSTSEAEDDWCKIGQEEVSESLSSQQTQPQEMCEDTEKSKKSHKIDDLAEYLYYRIRGFGNPINLVEANPGALTFHEKLLNIYVINTKTQQIHILDMNNTHLYSYDALVEGVDKKMTNFVDITMTPNEKIYVTDDIQRCAHEFDMEGNFIRSIGKKYLSKPHGIAVDSDGYIYIADSANANIIVFDKNGKFVRPLLSNENKKHLRIPTALALTSNFIIACNQRDNTVRGFSLTGQLEFTLCAFGEDRKLIGRPISVAVDSRGFIFVADDPLILPRTSRIHIFTPDAQYIRTFRKFGKVSGIAVNSDGRLAIGDITACCVSIY